jgi:hypothetical protein
MNLVEIGKARWRALINSTGKLVTYVGHDGSGTAELIMFIRGATAEELFGAAFQFDTIGVVDASAFFAAYPARPRPMKFDRVRTSGVLAMSYTVEEWRPAPADGGDPVALKLFMRGGSQ